MEHVMVTPGYPPVRIGDGPTIEVVGTDEAYHVRVNGIPQYMPHPYPNPTPIHGTPYEAYALGHWALNVFAIRLRPDTTTPSRTHLYEPDSCPEGAACTFHEMRHVHPVPELPPLRVETLNIRRGGIRFPVDPAIEAVFNETKGQHP